MEENRLFPPDAGELAARIRKTLLAERKAREWVFREQPERRREKTLEIDNALAALDELERMAIGIKGLEG